MDLEARFYHVVLPFYLIVSLKMEDNKEPLFDNKEVIKKD